MKTSHKKILRHVGAALCGVFLLGLLADALFATVGYWPFGGPNEAGRNVAVLLLFLLAGVMLYAYNQDVEPHGSTCGR